MSRLDYSKWDNIELSDDEDIEVHKNIDKASFIRWKQADIHRKREERRQRIEGYQKELVTNQGLIERIQEWVPLLRLEQSATEEMRAQRVAELVAQLQEYNKDKGAWFEPDAEGNYHPLTVDQVFVMMVSKLGDEQKADFVTDAVTRFPDILWNEIAVIEKRQTEVQQKLEEEEREQNKKLTSENICRPGFDKTKFSDTDKKKKTTSKNAVEVLNPNFQQHQKPLQTPAADDVDLRELSPSERRELDEFSKCKDYDVSFRYIQAHPNVVERAFADHLMARAFSKQSEGKETEAKLCVQWSLCLSYCLQMGPDGVGLFYQRMRQKNTQAVTAFEAEVMQSYTRLRDRVQVLKAEGKLPKMPSNPTTDEITPENSNLTPEQAVAFQTFPKDFQEALMEGDMELISAAFDKMGKEMADKVMAKCQEVGLISVLSEEEAQKMIAEEEERKQQELQR